MVHNPIEEGLVVTYIVPGLFGFEPFVLHYLLSFGKKFLIYTSDLLSAMSLMESGFAFVRLIKNAKKLPFFF